MTLRAYARRLAAVLGGCVVVSSLVAAANAAPGASAAPPADSASRAVSGGMYGEVTGGSSRTVPQAVVGPAQAPAASSDGYQNWESGGTVCGVYANSAGMGSYCSSGGGGVDLEPLVEAYPRLWAKFENCRFEDPPPGVDEPPNPSPVEKKWQLRTCLTAINWMSWNGGNDRRVIMDLVLVDADMDTTYHETRLSDFLWDTMQTMYPVPLLRVEPKTYPVVGQRAYFTFDWLNTKTQEPVPAGPFVEHHNGGITMRARATKMTIDPQIEGVKPFECTIAELGYDEDAGPDPDEQRSDCYHIFKRSSSAAGEISTSKHQLQGGQNVFRMKLDITWRVTYGTKGEMHSLGDYQMLVFQDLPVLDVEAMNEPIPPDVDIG